MASRTITQKEPYFINPANADRYSNNTTSTAQLITGQITNCSAEQQSSNQFIVRIGYHFPDPKGIKRKQRGTATIVRQDVHRMTLPKPGTPVMVLYRGADNYTVL